MVPRTSMEQNVVTIGVRNQEGAQQQYQIAIVADGATVDQWPSVTLEPGVSWTADVSLGPIAQRSKRIEAWLIRPGFSDHIYRRVWLVPAPT